MKTPNECQEYPKRGVFTKVPAKNSGISPPSTERSAYNRLSPREIVITPGPFQYCRNRVISGDHRLIKKTFSLCPVCGKVLEAEITDEEGKIWFVRTCPEHGKYHYGFWSDPGMYHSSRQYDAIGPGVTNPWKPGLPGTCDGACGICSNHPSGTFLAYIDLTNRYRLNCDFCFANARIPILTDA